MTDATFPKVARSLSQLRAEVFAEQILALPIDPALHRADDESTLGEYLAAILNQYLHDGEAFDVKRPLGDSRWGHPIDEALHKANLDYTALTVAVRDVLSGGPVARTQKRMLDGFEQRYMERVEMVVEVFGSIEHSDDWRTILHLRKLVFAALGIHEDTPEEAAA